MSNQKLSENENHIILKKTAGLDGRALSYAVNELSKEFNVGKQQIYKITKDVRPSRKPRSDRGKRKKDLMVDAFLRTATNLLVTESLTPEQAFEKAKAKFEPSTSLLTFKRYLKEHHYSPLYEKPKKVLKPEKAKPVFVVLESDVAKVFKDSDTVNATLRAMISIIRKLAETKDNQK